MGIIEGFGEFNGAKVIKKHANILKEIWDNIHLYYGELITKDLGTVWDPKSRENIPHPSNFDYTIRDENNNFSICISHN